jgi:hypothetical protein
MPQISLSQTALARTAAVSSKKGRTSQIVRAETTDLAKVRTFSAFLLVETNSHPSGRPERSLLVARCRWSLSHPGIGFEGVSRPIDEVDVTSTEFHRGYGIGPRTPHLCLV